MKTKVCLTLAAAVRFHNYASRHYSKVSPIITRGCLSRGFFYSIQFC